MNFKLQAVAIAVIGLGIGGAAIAMMNKDVPDYTVPAGPWEAGYALDGQVFNTIDTTAEGGEEANTLTFRDGKFQSAKCQKYCDFGWTDYQSWTKNDVIHFTATTLCPDAPHTVVWYGTVNGNDMQHEGTWTTRRWYWTMQIKVQGHGAPAAPADTTTSG